MLRLNFNGFGGAEKLITTSMNLVVGGFILPRKYLFGAIKGRGAQYEKE